MGAIHANVTLQPLLLGEANSIQFLDLLPRNYRAALDFAKSKGVGTERLQQCVRKDPVELGLCFATTMHYAKPERRDYSLLRHRDVYYIDMYMHVHVIMLLLSYLCVYDVYIILHTYIYIH